jgi:hypothetical protein
MQSCEFFRGWDSWTSWGRCDEYNFQRRRRKCLVAQPGVADCLGPSEHVKFCLDDVIENG